MTRHQWRPWQRKALERVRGQSRVALFMEMRLGKTPVIIQWAYDQVTTIRPRILIVAPLSTLDDWEEEIQRFGFGWHVHRLDRTDTRTRMEYVWAAWGWFLIHPQALWRNGDLSDEEWDAVIVDESTMIRNPKAKITKTLVNEYQHVPNRAILTGDPRPESDLDYFTQMQFLHGNFMGFRNYWMFRNVKYKQSPFSEWEWMPRPGVRDEIKSYVHEHAVVMTAKQVGMGNEAVFKTRNVDANARQRAAMKELVKKFSYDYIETNFATVRDVWLARIAGGFSPDRENPELLSSEKADGIVDLMRGEFAHQSSVIWFRFNEELRYVVGRLKQAKITAIGVHGDTPVDDRKKIRDAFNAGKYQAICVQVRLGRMGWNLSRADVAQYYSNAYDYESRSQSLKRIEHMTKKRPLLYIDWITKGSIDEEVVALLKEKRMNSRAFMRELNVSVISRLRRQYGLEGQTEEKETRRSKARRIFPGTRTD